MHEFISVVHCSFQSWFVVHSSRVSCFVPVVVHFCRGSWFVPIVFRGSFQSWFVFHFSRGSWFIPVVVHLCRVSFQSWFVVHSFQKFHLRIRIKKICFSRRNFQTLKPFYPLLPTFKNSSIIQ